MQGYLVRRALLVLPTIWGVSVVIFLAIRLLPGDAVAQTAGEFGASTPEQRRQLEEAYALDGNIVGQYLNWAGASLRGDFGTSIFSGRPVSDDLATRMPATAELGLFALIFSVSLALPVGIISAVRQNTPIDLLARGLAIGLLAIPSFWMGLLLLTYSFVFFGWVPPLEFKQLWDDPLANFATIWLPSLVLGASLSGGAMRFTRSAMLDILRQDYVRTARAKGLSSRLVVVRHAVRNAIIPVVTVIGLQIPILVGGTVVIEQVFSLPGMGSYLIDAIQRRDYPVVQAIVLLSGTTVVLSTLLIDCLYPILDPRIRFA